MLEDLIRNLGNPDYWRGMWLEAQIAWNLLRDTRVPAQTKLIPLFVVIYIVSPVDLVPGFIPVLGQLDDLAVLVLGLQMFVRAAPADIVQEYRDRLTSA